MSHQQIISTTIVAEEIAAEKLERAEKIARDKAERKGRNKRIRREDQPRHRAAWKMQVFQAIETGNWED